MLQTEIVTVICDRKQLKKLVDLSSQFESLKHVVYMEDKDDTSEPSLTGKSSDWVVESFSRVEKLGQQSLLAPDMPKPGDLAVIMYTSGSTGMPKVVNTSLPMFRGFQCRVLFLDEVFQCREFSMLRNLRFLFFVILLSYLVFLSLHSSASALSGS